MLRAVVSTHLIVMVVGCCPTVLLLLLGSGVSGLVATARTAPRTPKHARHPAIVHHNSSLAQITVIRNA